MPRNVHNLARADVALLPRERALMEFSRNLYNAMAAKGWKQSDLVRAVNKFMPEGAPPIGRDAISLYINGKTLPRAAVLKALADCLGMPAEELMPPRLAPSAVSAHVPPLDVQDAGGDTAWVRINQRVPWPVAIEIMRLLKGTKDADSA